MTLNRNQKFNFDLHQQKDANRENRGKICYFSELITIIPRANTKDHERNNSLRKDFDCDVFAFTHGDDENEKKELFDRQNEPLLLTIH